MVDGSILLFRASIFFIIFVILMVYMLGKRDDLAPNLELRHLLCQIGF